MQQAAAVAEGRLQEATGEANKAQHQLNSLEASAAAFGEVQQEVQALQEVYLIDLYAVRLPKTVLHGSYCNASCFCAYVASLESVKFSHGSLPHLSHAVTSLADMLSAFAILVSLALYRTFGQRVTFVALQHHEHMQ